MNLLGTIPLLFTCRPIIGESLVGFLLRLTEGNGLRNPNQILQHLNGRTSRPPGVSDVGRLAELCNCHPDEVSQLFGFGVKTGAWGTMWRLNGEPITKPYFISSRSLAYCPLCLISEPYLRAEWELTLNTCCPMHNVSLLRNCHECGRALRWKRPGVSICTCGARLTDAIALGADGFPLFIASLIRRAIDSHSSPTQCRSLSHEIRQKLANLSLDGLFKTLWLLGEVLPTLAPGRHKDRLPKKCSTSDLVLERAHTVLSHWPERFLAALPISNDTKTTNSEEHKTRQEYNAVYEYLSEDMGSEEFRFIRLAYEYQLNRSWGRRRRAISRSRPWQIELPLEY